MLKLNINVKDAQNLLDKAPKETKDKVNEAMVKIGEYMTTEVKDSIAGKKAEPKSVDTGRFLGSIRHQENPKEFSTTINSDVEYSGSLEYGTKGRTGRHHFRNSIERNREKINEVILRKIKE